MLISYIFCLCIVSLLYFTLTENKLITKRRRKKERQKLTKKLREEVLKRDHYTCKKCGASLKKEPHLLLEVDHIKPISKGGKTELSNLQTLCWKCNRKKSTKTHKY